MLQTALEGTNLSPDVSLKALATQTAALVAADLVDLVARARVAAVARLRRLRWVSRSAVLVLDRCALFRRDL